MGWVGLGDVSEIVSECVSASVYVCVCVCVDGGGGGEREGSSESAYCIIE